MDANKIFGLFDSGSMETPIASSLNSLPDKAITDSEFISHPLILMGMFTKMMLNMDNLAIEMLNFTFDGKLDNAGKIKFTRKLVCDRSYKYLCMLDLDDVYHLEIIIDKGGDNFTQMLKKALAIYVDAEEYERCKFIKEILSIVEIPNKLLK